MNNFNIAIISNNNIDLENSKLSRDELKNLIAPHIHLQETSLEKMMQLIVNVINLTPDILGSTDICYQDDKLVYQLCHYEPEKDKITDTDLINKISTHLVITKPNVYNNTVLICSKINPETNTCEPQSISSLDEISDLLYKRLVHTGVIIKTSGEYEIKEFCNSPIELLDNLDDYSYIELNIISFNLLFIIKKTNKDNNDINKKATRLLGNKKVNGDVLITMQLDNNNRDYGSLDINIIKKLLKLSSNKLDSRKLKDYEESEEQINNLPVVKNPYTILRDRLKNYKKVCNYCNEQVNVGEYLTCSGCYRAIYHKDLECNKLDWDKHKLECLNKVEPINS
jgi:hypothetical protein